MTMISATSDKKNLRKTAIKLFTHMNFGKAEREKLYRWLNLPTIRFERTDEHYQKLIAHLETLRSNEDREAGQWVLGIWIPVTSSGYRPKLGEVLIFPSFGKRF